MAFIGYCLCVALLCGVGCSPLGQSGSIYDYSSLYPVPSGPAVCEPSPNMLGLGIGYPYPLNNYPILPLPYPRNLWGSSPNIQSATTVCETTPNVVGILPLSNLQIPGVGSAVCDPSASVVGFLPYPNVPNVGATTVCETNPTLVPTPAVLPVNPCISPLPYPGLIPSYPYGMPFL